MAQETTCRVPTGTISQFLEKRGIFSKQEALSILRKLLTQVSALHASGHTHRSISTETVLLDVSKGVILREPEPVRIFRGTTAEDDLCPPELQDQPTVSVSLEIAAARQELSQVGVALDPRRIDVYQLGVLFHRMLTGRAPSGQQISSPDVSDVSPALRALIERALGHRETERFADCAALALEVDSVLIANVKKSTTDTPVGGCVLTPHDVHARAEDNERESARTGPEDDRADLPFSRLGPYQVLRRLGRGGMGDVYMGYEAALDRFVAIKVLPPALARDDGYVRRFHREAASAAKVIHPNVVSIHASSLDAEHHYFAMQYVEGESLDKRLARFGRLEVETTLSIIEQVLEGLEAVHQAGLVHRDIKPGNILLEKGGQRVRLADFGLAKNVAAGSSPSSPGAIVGTIDYIAPEQLHTGKVDRRSDLYSLGVVLYQMISGRLPFEAESPTSVMFLHAFQEPCSLRSLAEHVPPALEKIVDKLLVKDPERRYQSCAEVLSDIRRLRSDSMVPTTSSDCTRQTTAEEDTRAPSASSSERSPARAAHRRWNWNTHALLGATGFGGLIVLAFVAFFPSLISSPGMPRTDSEEKKDERNPSARKNQDESGRAPVAALPNTVESRQVPEGKTVPIPEPTPGPELPVPKHDGELYRFDVPGGRILAAVFSLDGQQVFCQSDARLLRWDYESGRLLSGYFRGVDQVVCATISSDGGRVARGRADKTIRLWDGLTGKELHVFRGLESVVHCVAISRSGRRVLAACGDMERTGTNPGTSGSRVRLWDAESGNEINHFACPEYPVRSLAFTADEQQLIVCCDAVIQLRDCASGKEVRRFIGHMEAVRSIAVSPDGRYLLSGSQDKTIRLWDMHSGAEMRCFSGHRGMILSVAFSADGRYLLSGSGSIKFAKGRTQSDENGLRLWDVASGRELGSLAGHNQFVTCVAFSPDGCRALSGGNDGSVRIWDLSAYLPAASPRR